MAKVKLTFDQWMVKVNEALMVRSSLTADDLPDVTYMDWYEDGYSPRQAASMAIKNAMDE